MSSKQIAAEYNALAFDDMEFICYFQS